DIADQLSAGIEAGPGGRLEPAPFAGGVLEAGLEGEGLTPVPGLVAHRHGAVPILGVDAVDPGLAQRALAAEEVLGSLVDEVDAAAWPADPHRRRGRVGHGAEPFLAFAQGGLGLAGVGDVHIDADL